MLLYRRFRRPVLSDLRTSVILTAIGQGAFSVAADVAALDALCDHLAVQEGARGAAHVEQLRTLLQLHAVGRTAGMELSTVPHAALALGCSEHRAGQLLGEALGLGELPGGLEAVACGLLTVEQSSTVVRQLAPLPFPTRLQVWARLQERLLREADRGPATVRRPQGPAARPRRAPGGRPAPHRAVRLHRRPGRGRPRGVRLLARCAGAVRG